MTGGVGDLTRRYRVASGVFSLANHDPGEIAAGLDKQRGEALLARSVKRLARLQRVLAADASRSLLLVLQAMDTGGKDGAIRHVMSGINPQGVRVTSFKQPSAAEQGEDFLRRVHAAAPSAGEIGLFNRSHYEDVLVARVHPDRLAARLREPAAHASFWGGRLADIAAFETYLTHQGVAVRKVFLHISKEEQRRRLLARLDDPRKTWKLSAADLAERACWDNYQQAYEAAIGATSTEEAPWFVVPGDHKWFARLVVVQVIVEALKGMALKTPQPDPEDAATLREARATLEAEGDQPRHGGSA